MSIAHKAIEFILSTGCAGYSGCSPTKQVDQAAPTTKSLPGAAGAPSPIKPAHTTEGFHPYHFRLKGDKGGGVYLSPAETLDVARAELERRYGKDLLLVSK